MVDEDVCFVNRCKSVQIKWVIRRCEYDENKKLNHHLQAKLKTSDGVSCTQQIKLLCFHQLASTNS
jgi:hypothetical protein